MKKELKEDLERLMAFVPDEHICHEEYVKGWENEAKELKEAICGGVEITERWLARDIVVRLFVPTQGMDECEIHFEQHKKELFFSGSCSFRSIAMDLVHIHSFENPTKEMIEYRNRIFTEILK